METMDTEKLNQALMLLHERLAFADAPKVSLVVCGGSALIATGLVSRTTQDVDVLAMLRDEDLIDPEPMPDYLISAAEATARTLRLPADWLNCGPADLFRMGLPEGTKERLIRMPVGERLTIFYVSRIDQIFFKLYAAVDRGGYHIEDLLQLNPTSDELYEAARWTMTHDVSEGFKMMLCQLLTELGFENVSQRL